MENMWKTSENQIVNIRVAETMIGPIEGPPMVLAVLRDGDEVPLFPFQEERINYDLPEFIGLTPETALELKRVKDLVWFGEVLF